MATQKRRKLVCPECGSKHIVPVKYGLLPHRVFEEMEEYEKKHGRPKFVLGGCIYTPGSPNYPEHACLDCDCRF